MADLTTTEFDQARRIFVEEGFSVVEFLVFDDGEVAFFVPARELSRIDVPALTTALKSVIRHKKVWVNVLVEGLGTDSLVG